MKSFLLKPLYARALGGLPLLGTPAETAGRFLAHPGTLAQRAEEMAQVHLALCASTGFVCGLGGFLTLPVTLPTNVVGVALIQLHLCSSTAFLASLDLNDRDVRQRCIGCVTGAITADPERDETQEMVDRSAVKVAERGLRLVAETAIGLAGAAGKFTVRHAVNRRLPRRSLPIIGGFIGGASDLYNTQRVAAAARAEFLGTSDSDRVAPRTLIAQTGGSE